MLPPPNRETFRDPTLKPFSAHFKPDAIEKKKQKTVGANTVLPTFKLHCSVLIVVIILLCWFLLLLWGLWLLTWTCTSKKYHRVQHGLSISYWFLGVLFIFLYFLEDRWTTGSPFRKEQRIAPKSLGLLWTFFKANEGRGALRCETQGRVGFLQLLLFLRYYRYYYIFPHRHGCYNEESQTVNLRHF